MDVINRVEYWLGIIHHDLEELKAKDNDSYDRGVISRMESEIMILEHILEGFGEE